MGSTLFLADWVEAVFLHFRVPPEVLQPDIPFPLDLREGAAWVSLVAFTMQRMRPVWGQGLGEWLLRTLSPCRFLNVRTYVTSQGEPGIYFLKEWISNRWSVPLGPVSFGLPYRLGQLDYQHDCEGGKCAGSVHAPRDHARLTYVGAVNGTVAPQAARPGSLEAFLLERYTAFTSWAGWQRCFRIEHEPWPQRFLEAEVHDEGLLAATGPWGQHAAFAGAHLTRGVFDVRISWPQGLAA